MAEVKNVKGKTAVNEAKETKVQADKPKTTGVQLEVVKETPAPVKEAVKETTAPAKAAVKEEPEAKKAVEKKAPAKAKTTKKTTTAKTTTAKKATIKKEEPAKEEAPVLKIPTVAKNANVYVQYQNRENELENLKTRIVEKWCAEEGKKPSSIKEMNIYIKPEDNAAYYVINGQGSSIALF